MLAPRFYWHCQIRRLNASVLLSLFCLLRVLRASVVKFSQQELTTETRRTLRKIGLFRTEPKLLLATGNGDSLRRVIDAARLLQSAVSEIAFDDFVTEQREHAPANEQRPRVAVPIDARCAAGIVRRFFRLSGKLAGFGEVQRVVTQKKDRRRLFKQVTITRPAGQAYRQTKHA